MNDMGSHRNDMGMENTTQQLHYMGDNSTTQGQIPVPAPPPTELISGRVPVPAGPPPPETMLVDPTPTPPPAREAGRGKTTISDDVVERVIQKVVDLTVDEVDGVHGLRPGVDKFFTTETDATAAPADRAVAVKLADGKATINLSLEVDFGYAVHDVVNQVRATVIGSAERLLGMTIAEVNVVVSEVSFDAPAAVAETETGDESGAGRRPAGGRRPRT